MSYLELSHINKEFSGTFAVEDFNLSAVQGEFVSFLGPSGCGKTTTLRMIAGFEQPTTGKIFVNGQDITFTAANKRKVGMVFQSYALFPNMTVHENIGYGLKIAGKNRQEIARRVDEMLKLIQLEGFDQRYPNRLSGGQQQRVALARALAFNPQVLLLDEPLSALDAKIRVELRQEIRRIQRQLGITTIYVTHDQEEALSLSDRVVVMSRGRIEQIGTPMTIYNCPANEFVASFVGQLNIVPVQVKDINKNEVLLNGQVLRASRRVDNFESNRARLAVRPEEINPGYREGHNTLKGVVESINYMGPIVRIRLNINTNYFTIDMFNEHKLTIPVVNETFEVNFPAEACWLM